MKLLRSVALYGLALFVGVGGLVGCGGSASFTLDQQANVVQFLKQLNIPVNNLNEALKAANLGGNVWAGTLDGPALSTLAQRVGEYQSQVNAIAVPANMSELAELKSAVQEAQSQVQKIIQQMGSALQTYNAAELSASLEQLSRLPSDYNKHQKLEESLLSKYRIPDNT